SFAGPATAGEVRDGVDRVLVFSMPAAAWSEVGDADLPHLDRFLDGAAIAGLSTRVHDPLTSPGDGYATMGAGARARGGEQSGLAFDAAERYGDGTAAEEHRRRTGSSPPE